MRKHAALLGALLLAVLPACPSHPQVPRVAPAADVTVPIEGAIRGVAASGGLMFAAVETAPTEHASVVRAFRGDAEAWHADVPGSAGPIAATNALVVTTSIAGAGSQLDGSTVRGEPAAGIRAFDAATGAVKWTRVLDSTEWALATSIATLGDGVVVGGSFGGTLRAGKHVVSSAGGSDGFVARIGANGDVAWLLRLGGAGADGVQGIATRGEKIAIAGTFTSGAELGGVALPAYTEDSPFGDAFAAELDGNGKRRWAQTFGGRADDAVAGVAIDDRNHVIVAGSVHEVVHVGSAQLVTQGASDGIVVWYGDDGEKGAAVLIGGLDFDGLRAITAVGDKAVVAGFFSGAIKLADRTLTAGGGDDSFIAALDANGTLARGWHVGGEGREEVTSLSALPGGLIAGVAHTAKAAIEDVQLAAPKDPMRGSAVVVRGVP